MKQFTPPKNSVAACAALLITSAPAFAGGLANEISEPQPLAPIAVPAPTSTGYYISVFAGGNVLSDVETDYNSYGDIYGYSVELDTGYVAGIAFGRKINERIRVEAELSHASADAKEYLFSDTDLSRPAEGDLTATYLLANVWYDIPTAGPVGFYVGGGLGAAKVEGDTTFNGSDFGYGPGETKLAGQVGAGVVYDLSQSLALDVGYRFKYVGDVDFDDNDGDGVYEAGDVQSHSLQAGISYRF